MRHETAKVAAHDAVPGRSLAVVKLDIKSQSFVHSRCRSPRVVFSWDRGDVSAQRRYGTYGLLDVLGDVLSIRLVDSYRRPSLVLAASFMLVPNAYLLDGELGHRLLSLTATNVSRLSLKLWMYTSLIATYRLRSPPSAFRLSVPLSILSCFRVV